MPLGAFRLNTLAKALASIPGLAQFVATMNTSSPFINIYSQSEDTFTKLSDPATLPAGVGWASNFSADGTYLAVGHTTTPFLTIYKRSGTTFTKLSDPATLPNGQVTGVHFSRDGIYLATCHASSPFITIYKRSGDTFTKLSDPATLPVQEGRGVMFDDTATYLLVTTRGFTDPKVSVYKRSGDTFTKLTDPSAQPTDRISWGGISNDGVYAAVGQDSTPFVNLYKREGDTWSRLANPTTLPTASSATRGGAFDPTGTYLAFMLNASPWIYIYKRAGDAFHKLSDPATLPTGGWNGMGVSWSNDSQYLTCSHGSSPFITVYKRSGDTFTKLSDPATLPNSAGRGATSYPGAFTYNNLLDAVEFDSGVYYENTNMPDAGTSNKQITVSVWVNAAQNSPRSVAFGLLAGGRLIAGPWMYNSGSAQTNATARFYVQTASQTIDRTSTENELYNTNGWNHFAYSLDLTVDNRILYFVNGVQVTVSGFTASGITTDILWNNLTEFFVHGYNNANHLNNLKVAQLWIDNSYIDLSTNISKFYDNGPVDMGVNGTASGLSQPLIYHNGNTSTFPTNNGTLSYSLTAVGTPKNTTGPREYSGSINQISSPPPTLSTITVPGPVTTSTGSQVGYPSGYAIGDVMVLFDTSNQTASSPVPSGWTLISNVAGSAGSIRTIISYKIITSFSDPAPTGMVATSTTRKLMVGFRGNIPITGVTATVRGEQATSSAPSNQSLVGVAGPMVAIAAYGKTTSTTPTRGWSVGSPTEYSNVSTHGIFVKQLITNSGTPATTTISMTDAGVNTLQSFTLQFT